MKPSIGLRLLILVFGIVVLNACSTTKYVPDGQYLLNKVSISSDLKSLQTSNAELYVRQLPNTKLFDIIPFNLKIYSASSPDTALWINRFLRKIGDAPVIYDSTLTTASQNELRKYMNNQGYLNAQVVANTSFKKKKAKVRYHITAGTPYTIRSIQYNVRNQSIQDLVYADTANCLLAVGDLFDINILEKERERIADHLKNNGYYQFDKEYVGFVADSSLNNHQVDLRLIVRPMRLVSGKNNYLTKQHETYYVRNIHYYAIEHLQDLQDSGRLFEKNSKYPNHYFHYTRMFVRPKALYNASHINTDQLFSAQSVDQTYAKLSALNIFKHIAISFNEVGEIIQPDSSVSHLLDCQILLTPEKNQSFSFEVEGTNNEGDFGIAGKVGYEHANIFKGGEAFKINVRGANESLIGRRTIWEVSTEAGLTFPSFLFPFLRKNFIQSNPAKTDIYVNFSYQIRTDYERMIAGTGMRYRWQTPEKINHQIDIIDFNYVYLPYLSDNMKKTITNSLLKYSYEDHLIMRAGYNVSYSNKHQRANQSYYAVRGAVETGGNLLYAISMATHANRDSAGSYLVGHIPFAQYAKADVDFTYTQYVDTRNSIAYHIGGGIGVPYHNSTVLPFEKRYFGGGANSVRGWSARSLGPGNYNAGTHIDYMKQSGDINLNLNFEYRTHLVWKLELALFADAGNIWTLRNEGQADGQFKWNRFYEQIALGYGLGVRLNFSYFVLRLDWGIKAFDPAQSQGNRWRFNNTWDILTDTALHFAVGYPF